MGTTRTSWISEYLHTFPYLMHDHDPHLCARWWYSRHRPGTSSPPPLAVATPSAPICHPTAETRRIQLHPVLRSTITLTSSIMIIYIIPVS
jgi:hypothetical protein